MFKALVAGILGVVMLSGCNASNAPNMVNKDGNYANQGKTLADIRGARRSITIYSKIPSSAINTKELAVQRCHRNFIDSAPSRAVLEDDLILEAYANGADGIANIEYTKQNGLLQNCWHIQIATATSFRLN